MKSESSASPAAFLLYEFLGTALVTYSFSLGGSKPHLVRAYAYFIGWLIAFHVSGAQFNPAVTLAVFITERQTKNWLSLFLIMFVQILGSFLGIFITFILAKYYTNYTLLPDLSIGNKDMF